MFLGETMSASWTVGVCVFLLLSAGSISGFGLAPTSGTRDTWLYVGGSGPGNFTTIQAAVDNASDGDTVFVYDDAAPYAENVEIHVSVTILGERRNTTIVEGGHRAFSVYADNVRVSGFTIRNVGDFWNCCGVYALSSGNRIDNLTIANNFRINGVFLDGATNTTVRDCLIAHNNYHGMRLEYATGNHIVNVTVVDNRGYGIYLWESFSNRIEASTVTDSFWPGIMLGDSSGNTIVHNTFRRNPGNAYDDGANTWDDGYPSGGNFWDDYNGTDTDGDGIGDTPYVIPGNTSVDRYPLMRPIGPQYQCVWLPSPGVVIQVTNVGTLTGEGIVWDISLEGGLITFWPWHRTRTGVIQRLAPGENTTLTFSRSLLGLGSYHMTVTVEGSSTVYPFLLVFVFRKPMGT